MAILFGSITEGNATGTTITQSFTTGGSSTALLVGINSRTSDAVTAVTYAGVAMTQISKVAVTNGYLYLYGLLSPANGANNVVITLSSSQVVYYAISYYTGVKQSSFPEVFTSKTMTAKPVTTSLTTLSDNSWTVLVAGSNNDGTTSISSGIGIKRNTVQNVVSLFDSNSAITPVGSTSLIVTVDASSTTVATIMASMAPLLLAVTTQAVTDIDFSSATGNGEVTDDGGFVVTERGIVWSTSASPTTASNKATVSGTTGIFSAPITGLSANTLYYVRSYAINSTGTSYGNEVTFTTLATEPNTIYKDISGVDGETYAVSVDIGGTTGTLTISLGSTGSSETFNAGAGVVTMQGVYGGLNGLIFEASPTFDGYIDDVMWVLVLGTATINWTLDSLTNVFPIDSSVVFRRLESKDFNTFRIYRLLDTQFKDLDAYVTVLLKKESNEELVDASKSFLVSNTSEATLPFINKRISMLTKNQAIRIGYSNARLNETFTICQFIVKGMLQPAKLFDKSKITSV
jgi:hypothetical protein